jgi:hypothetical protein
MHCPNCGTEASAGQKFCRACGLSLERFAQLLAELLPDGEDELNKKVSERSPSQPKLPPAETTNKLLSEDQPLIVMSVTEQTTARLDEKVGESR